MIQRVEVAAQVRVDHLRMPLDHQGLNALDRLQGAAPGAVGVLLRLPVGLEDRLQDHQGSRLYDTILDRRDAQRSLFTVRLGDVHPPHGLRTIRLPAEFFRQFAQPLPDAVGLDVLEGLPVHARRAGVDPAALVGVPQHIPPVHLVVQRVEAVGGLLLRFGMQRLLELPNRRRR
jgi:hypothetical protein